MKLLSVLLVVASLSSIARANVTIVEDHGTLTLDCGKDPNITIASNDNTILISGTCTQVTIAGNHNTVTATATAISVPGNHNTVSAVSDQISVAGNDNTVAAKPIKLKASKVANVGNHNTIK